MSLEIKGTITQILPPVSGVGKTGKEWNKQEFVVVQEGEYGKPVCLTLFGEKANIISNFAINDEVKVGINVESREFNEKYYHNINAWRIEKAESVNASAEYKAEDEPTQTGTAIGDPSDLPF